MIQTLILWGLPPLVGAIIGYVTNAIAIKMLFRPLKEIRVFGIRLPFTPGILPRERHKLALNIGSMVERELFTPEILRTRLKGEDFRHKLKISIAEYTEKILGTPVSQLIPQKTSSGGISDIARIITLSLRSFIHSPSFESILEKITDELVARLDHKSLRDILGQEITEKLEDTLSQVIRDSIKRSAPRITEHVMPAADRVFSSFTSSLVDFLMKDEIHQELEVHGRIFLTNAVLKLNAIQRFFISAGQYDKTIHDKMPEIIDDLIKQLDALLKDGNTKKRLTVFFRNSVKKMFSSEKNVGQVTGFIMGLISSYIDEPLEDVIKGLSKKDLRLAGRKLIGFIRARGNENLDLRLGQIIDGFIEKYKDSSLSGLFSFSPEQKEKFDGFISGKILEIADERIESLLTSIDVKTMVSDRIDTLDMVRVERIVLDVMDNQLKWINVFGGILGGLIGLFQAGFGWFMR